MKSHHHKPVQVEGDWIRDLYPWEFFITLTYKYEVREYPAKQCYGRFLKNVARQCGVHVDVASGGAYQDRGAYHHHALMFLDWAERRNGPSSITAEELKSIWKATAQIPHPSRPGFTLRFAGSCHIVEYDPAQAASYYITMHEVSHQIACPRHLPCRRKKGCIRGPSGL